MSMGMTDRFAVFILTHGRPDKVITYRTLRNQGYTGVIYIIVDNEDKTIDRYRENYGDAVIVFDKLAISKTFDTGDNFEDRRAVVYARNACWKIAEELGLDYFLQLDDDYRVFNYKFTAQMVSTEKPVLNIDRLFCVVLDYYKKISAATIALAQNGDFLGGVRGGDLSRVWLKRKAMNVFFCATSRPFQFVGRINEDVNTYTSYGNRGLLMGTIFSAAIIQESTQTSEGGMTGLYLNEGTYIKSFYTIMYCPSFVKVYMMGDTHKRMHHRISWNNAVPKILSENCRRAQP